MTCTHSYGAIYGIITTKDKALEVLGYQSPLPEDSEDSEVEDFIDRMEFLYEASLTVEGYQLSAEDELNFGYNHTGQVGFGFVIPRGGNGLKSDELMSLAQASSALDGYFVEKFGQTGSLFSFLTGCSCCS